MITIVFQKILSLFLLTVVGFIAAKKHIITKEVNKGLSAIFVNITIPALLIGSFQLEFSAEKVRMLLLTCAITAVGFLIFFVGSALICKVFHIHEPGVAIHDMVIFNGGMIALPIVGELYGAEGLFCFSATLALLNLLTFTSAELLMSPNGAKLSLKGLFSMPVNAVIIGILLFVSGLRLPPILGSTLSSIGSMSTPLGLFISGAAIAEISLKHIHHLKDIVITTVSGLVVLPVLLVSVLAVMPVPALIKFITLISFSCPPMSVTAVLAMKYGRDYLYASEIFMVSSIGYALTVLPIFYLGSVLF